MKSGKNFFSDGQGSVAIIFGLAFIFVLIGILSLTIDMNRTQTSYNKNQGATDAAAAGSAELWLKAITNNIGVTNSPFATAYPDTSASTGGAAGSGYAETLLKENFDRDQSSAIYDPSSLVVTPTRSGPDAGGVYTYTVAVTACANLSTALAEAAGHDKGSTRSCTTSNASFGLTVAQNLEVAFALDFTNSMFWVGDPWPGCNNVDNTSNPSCPPYTQTKAYYLADAMNQTLSNTAFFPQTNSTVWASIVPFSSIVNLYPYNNQFISGGTTLTSTASAEGQGLSQYQGTGATPFNLQISASQDPNSPSYQIYNRSNYYTDYGTTDQNPDYSYYEDVLDRIPALEAGTLNSIVGDSSDFANTKFPSYRTVLNTALSSGESADLVRNLCYNAALVAAFDQRIEKQVPNNVNQNNAGLVKFYEKTDPVEKDPPQAYADLDSYNTANLGSKKLYTAYESYPIQPLTSNTQILKDVVNRFTATTQLYTAAENYATAPSGNANPPTAQNTVGTQSLPLTKSSAWSSALGTSGVHGMLWAWLTINNNWQDKWDAQSLHESYYSTRDSTAGGADGAASASSRQGLPSPKHTKHIIFMTDGNDNDGSGFICDGYAPVAKLATTDYDSLCNKIKGEGVIIHVLLLAFNPTPDTVSRFDPSQGGCASPGEFYNGVQPDQILPIMNKIFRTIITNAATVQLTK